jgi:predicted Zn-dependent peptidase
MEAGEYASGDKLVVDTQNEVVKEEKKTAFDNSPYGQIIPEVKKRYSQIPYRWTTVGSMDHLDAATLTEFQDFNKKFYIRITPFL